MTRLPSEAAAIAAAQPPLPPPTIRMSVSRSRTGMPASSLDRQTETSDARRFTQMNSWQSACICGHFETFLLSLGCPVVVERGLGELGSLVERAAYGHLFAGDLGHGVVERLGRVGRDERRRALPALLHRLDHGLPVRVVVLEVAGLVDLADRARPPLRHLEVSAAVFVHR